MKRCNLISPLVLLSGLLLVMLMVSCSKEGGAGPQGPVGPAGPKGDDGSGNVTYSAWFDVLFKADTIHMANGKIDTVGYYTVINVPKLTAALVSTADVKIYINVEDASAPVIYPLPYNSSSGLYIQFSAYAQTIELYSNVDLSTVLSNGKKYQQYRYMIVPGNVLGRSANPVNWSDYAEVKTYLGLKD